MSSIVMKFVIFTFVLILAYFLLVYYKGGVAYVGAGSSAYNTGVNSFLSAAKQGYAKG